MNYDFIKGGKFSKDGTAVYFGDHMLSVGEKHMLVEWAPGVLSMPDVVFCAHIAVNNDIHTIEGLWNCKEDALERFEKRIKDMVLHPCFVCTALEVIFLDKSRLVLCTNCGTLAPLEAWVYTFYQ